MFKNYIKVALRNISRNKTYSAINIIGLGLGLAASYIMMLIVFHEMSFDKYNENYHVITRILTELPDYEWVFGSTPYPLAEKIKENIPEAVQTARIFQRRLNVVHNDVKFQESYSSFVDKEIFDILTIPLLRGNKNSIFKDPYSIVISEKVASKYFGNTNPLGEVLHVSMAGIDYDLTISGVFKDFPETSTFRSGLMLPIELSKEIINKIWSYKKGPAPVENWEVTCVYTYAMFKKGFDEQVINSKLQRLNKYFENEALFTVYRIQRMENFYFKSEGISRSYLPTGDSTKNTVFMIIATLVLLISCINYIILATAQSIKRAKEIGIRKIIGASKLSIFMHLFFEAWVIALLSMPITIMLTELLLPEISASLNVRISMDYIHDIRFLYGLFILISFVALLSSLYVAVFISKLQTIEILKFKFNTKGSRFNLRHGFIFLQLSIFAGLIFSTLVIKSQLKFFRENSFGYDKENVFVIRTYDKELPEKYSTLINELRKIPEIENISAASELPPQLGGMLYKLPNNKNPKELVEINGFSVDYNFIQTLGLELIEGRDFSREYSTDSLSGIILNETAMSRLELEDERTIYGFKIIGVVKDFNFGSLHDPISPMAFQLASKIKYLNEIAILINSKNVSGTVEKIKSTWNKLFSTPPIKYFFLNEKVDKLYRSDEKFSKLINIFTGFAIFITCLGLFGLTMYITQQRTKEIGIRKVFGAKVKNIYLLMSKEFIFLLLGALIVGLPIGLMLINQWLFNFAYKVNIGLDLYLLTAISALIILLLAISIQSIRAAVVNPVDSLRDE